MIDYLDTSIIVRLLANEPKSFDLRQRGSNLVTSALSEIEALRWIDRRRLQNALTDREVANKRGELQRTLSFMKTVEIGTAVLRRAGESFPTSIRTLDAIHLASAILYQAGVGAKIGFVTHDIGQATAAQALGFEVIGCT